MSRVVRIVDQIETDPAPGTVCPIGHIEGADAISGVVGWACVPGRDGPVAVDLLVNGIAVARSRTRIARPDLAIAGLPHRHSGFSIPVPRSAIQQTGNDVDVLVDGTRLEGGPVRLATPEFADISVGEMDAGSLPIVVSGWPGDAVMAMIELDGATAHPVMCVRETDDPVDAPLRGEFHVSGKHLDAQLHVVVAWCDLDGRRICTDAAVRRLPDYRVHIDSASHEKLVGWAFRTDARDPVRLRIERQGERAVRSLLGLARPDVSAAFGAHRQGSGFDVAFGAPRASMSRFDVWDDEAGLLLAEISVMDGYETLRGMGAWHRAHGEPSNRIAWRRLVSLQTQASTGVVVDERRFPLAETARTDVVTVVVPVYGGPTETAECIDSVLAAVNDTPVRIVLVNDATPDPLISSFLEWLRDRGIDNLTIIERSTNGGFSEAINIGMIAAGRDDVILLNADTVVQNGWVDRLRRAAYSEPGIATVTPFTNNGEICTAPTMCASLAVHDPDMATALARTAARVNDGETVELPVGIGFCLYVRRSAIDEIGHFDAKVWGRGYGEEVDFCLTASAAGWKHLLAADTYVVHRGNVSFGAEKFERIIESARKVAERYPFYDQCIETFVARDPLRAVRRKLNLAMLLPRSKPCVLHISHDLGGGTRKYVTDVAAEERAAGMDPIVLEWGRDGVKLRLDVDDPGIHDLFQKEHVEQFGITEREALMEVVKALRPTRVHLHSPIGVDREFLDWVTAEFPYRVTIHDYVWICPRVTLTRPGGRYCGEPEVETCNRCIEVHSAHSAVSLLIESFNGNVPDYKEFLLNTLDRADAIIAGTEDVAVRLKRHGLASPIQVKPHPDSIVRSSDSARKASGQVIRVGLIGALSEEKGFFKLIEVANYSQINKFPIEFIVIGTSCDNEKLKTITNTIILGQYDDDKVYEILKKESLDIALFLHQWPETYSYALSHALAMKIWPVVLEIGAASERVRKAGFGSILPSDSDAKTICAAIMKDYENVGL